MRPAMDRVNEDLLAEELDFTPLEEELDGDEAETTAELEQLLHTVQAARFTA